ncbi:Lysine exporter protein (LYSE/YGGA) [Allomuricauda ruestringensis DSM 13258]|uniref:Lysine exporter protein (LYSE/YGGA) n=1 Tax=Allomuricauda ruestringensis (strain DSM 13258 / CIP 107369 / LMG 19739 / B1) TaxID=886377 RepID=G2PRG9_ALLRU|nr:LysE family translocator [Allomuricauda ruestringensis]AEM69418.1 Lysine exporter protein (LYSE/YGGA) [Allomuricauda ruestringensis DSM 13258]
MHSLFLFLETINYPILIGFLVSSLALAISPGPDNIFVLTQSISNGTKSGLATVFGLVSGCLVHTTLLAFGVSEIIKRSDTLFFLIKLFGALYLLFLALKVYKSDSAIHLDKENKAAKPHGKLFWTGFTMNVLNPKVTIFFLAFFPGFLFSEELNTVIQFYILGLLFMLSALIVFGTIAVLAGKISKYLISHKKAGLYLKWVQIVVFVGIAIYLFLSDK